MPSFTIWKFKVLGRDFGVAMPRGARVLTVQTQGEDAAMWALVDPNAEVVVREFRLVLTGGVADVDGWNYVGTFQQDWFVGHLFEKPRWSGLMFPKTRRPRALVRRDRQRQEEATYRANSAKARERDGHCCRVCGRHWGLETHHMKPRSLNRRSPSKHDLDRLLTLCAGPKSCHEAVNQKVMRLTCLTDQGTNAGVLVEKWDDDVKDYVVAMKVA